MTGYISVTVSEGAGFTFIRVFNTHALALSNRNQPQAATYGTGKEAGIPAKNSGG